MILFVCFVFLEGFRRGLARVYSFKSPSFVIFFPFRLSKIEANNIFFFLFTLIQEQLHEAVSFLQSSLAENRKVYVHCQGGHGRSAAVCFAHLCLDDANDKKSSKELNEELSKKWRVRKGLYSQPQLNAFLNKRKSIPK